MIDEAELFTVHVEGGMIWAWEHNRRAVRCRRCNGAIETGEGYKFQKVYRGEMGSGYLCKGCIHMALIKVGMWHWNPFTEELYPQREYTRHPVDGASLGAAWLARGARGVRDCIKAQTDNRE
jgi:hypothetical protein